MAAVINHRSPLCALSPIIKVMDVWNCYVAKLGMVMVEFCNSQVAGKLIDRIFMKVFVRYKI